MSRAIKFRVWDEKRGQMFAVENLIFTHSGGIWIGFHADNPSRNAALFCGEGAVLMQFTGLLDKDGREIYEGDTLTASSGFKGVVTWWQDLPGFLIVAEKATEFSSMVGTWEIIGNIYENPDLLRAKE